MYQNNILIHRPSGELLRLVRIRKSNVNTFIQVDINGNPIIKKRSWSARPQEQLRLIKGFKNIEIFEQCQKKQEDQN